MRFFKIQLLIIALFAFVGGAALATPYYIEVTVDTSSLDGSGGYLYFQYTPANGADSTATITDYTGGYLAPFRSSEVDGSAVTGLLPGEVVFANTNGINDYNQGIAFDNSILFRIFFSDPAPGGQVGGSSTFSLGLFQDEFGGTPLLTQDGTLFAANLMNDGSVTSDVFAPGVRADVIPEANTLWLFGSGLLGLLGVGRKMKMKK